MGNSVKKVISKEIKKVKKAEIENFNLAAMIEMED
jgi:hypothetical protein